MINTIINNINAGLPILGGITLIFMVVAVVFLGTMLAVNIVGELIYRYKYKHRFSKKPIAKCYCNDCTQYDKKAGYCKLFSSYLVAENCFCGLAEPKSKE